MYRQFFKKRGEKRKSERKRSKVRLIDLWAYVRAQAIRKTKEIISMKTFRKFSFYFDKSKKKKNIKKKHTKRKKEIREKGREKKENNHKSHKSVSHVSPFMV